MLKNILANFIGKFWSIFAVYAFTPIYIKLLGIDNFGLISFYTIILSFVGLMDVGLSATLSREFAKKSDTQADKLTTVKTLEVVYLFAVGFILLSFFFLSPIISNQWLKITSVSPSKVERCILYMGLMASAQILINFYSAGLIGLEKQVKANLILVFLGIIRSGVVILIFFFIEKDIEYFFLWQLLSSVFFVVFSRMVLLYDTSKKFDMDSKIKFDFKLLKERKSFLVGVFFMGLVSSINTHLDKILISNFLSIKDLAYYNLAFSISQVISSISFTLYTAFLPRATLYHSENEKELEKNLFFLVFKILCYFGIPLCVVIAFNSFSIIEIWTRDLQIAHEVSNILPFTIMGALALSLQIAPYTITMAHGYTKINNIIGLSSLLFTIPMYYILVTNFGLRGAALCWLFSQSIITVIFYYFINKKFFENQALWGWFFKNVSISLIVSFVVTYLVSILFSLFHANYYFSMLNIALSLITIALFNLRFIFEIKQIKDLKIKLIK